MDKSVQFINGLFKLFNTSNVKAYLKVPASYLCQNKDGKTFISRIQSVPRVIV